MELTNSRWGWRRGWGQCSYPGWPPELEWLSGVGHDPGGLVPWKERKRKKKNKGKQGRGWGCSRRARGGDLGGGGSSGSCGQPSVLLIGARSQSLVVCITCSLVLGLNH